MFDGNKLGLNLRVKALRPPVPPSRWSQWEESRPGWCTSLILAACTPLWWWGDQYPRWINDVYHFLQPPSFSRHSSYPSRPRCIWSWCCWPYFTKNCAESGPSVPQFRILFPLQHISIHNRWMINLCTSVKCGVALLQLLLWWLHVVKWFPLDSIETLLQITQGWSCQVVPRL